VASPRVNITQMSRSILQPKIAPLMLPPFNHTFETKLTSNEQIKQMAGLKMTAFREYMSARILFNKGLLQPACILANTCIEKELKVCLIAAGIEKKLRHDSLALFEEFESVAPEMCKLFNKDFITALANIYKSRYHDGLPVGYRYVIVRNKFLAELDYTYIILTEAHRQSSPIGPTSPFARMNSSSNQDLYFNNYFLNELDKSNFLSKPDRVNEMFINPNHQVYEVDYIIDFDTEPTKFQFDYGPLSFTSNGDYSIPLAFKDAKNLRVGIL
jgi:HEPN domain-containing protein